MLKFKELDWTNVIFIFTYHILLLITIPLYLIFKGLPSIGIWVILLILILFIGISITAGYHRLYSHKAYKTNKFIEACFLFFGVLAIENSVLTWSFRHRNHHRFVDTDKDPYSIKKGFWYAHILCIFEKSKPTEKKFVQDLIKNKLVMFQHKYYNQIYIIGNLLLITSIGYFLNDFFGAFVFCYLLRTFLIHHMTFSINSIAHVLGSKTYSKEATSADNYFFIFFYVG